MNGDKKQKTESGLKCVRQVLLQGVTGDPIVFDSTRNLNGISRMSKE